MKEAYEHVIRDALTEEFGTSEDRRALLDSAYKRGIIPADLKALYEEALRRGLVKSPDGPVTGTEFSVAEELVADWTRRREAGAFVLLPSLGVLVLGIGLAWAAEGFRRH